jgi:3-deoxy-D-manno-octulosonic-acid transferase
MSSPTEMEHLYQIGMRFAAWLVMAMWRSRAFRKYLLVSNPKIYKFILGQWNLLTQIHEKSKGNQQSTYWFHAASYGEYNVIRPIIQEIRKKNIRVVVTFFSSSGFEALIKKNQKSNEVDDVFYLPWDTKKNASLFLDEVKPQKAIFAISEYWINYLNELGRRNIPTYFVSMYVGKKSYLLKWYGRTIRKALHNVHTFMVLDEESKNNLGKIGFDNVIVTGDPLFDNAISLSHKPYHNKIIERFCNGSHDIFVAGSTSDKKDLALVSALANTNPDVKFIVAPHEISEESLHEIIYHMKGKTLLCSECDTNTDFRDTQILAIDFFGSLSQIYSYGRWAYVGGGFTPHLHSVIEPVVYGIPVAFGPKIRRKKTATRLVETGIGHIVRNPRDIKAWFMEMSAPKKLARVSERSRQYINCHSSVSANITKIILS